MTVRVNCKDDEGNSDENGDGKGYGKGDSKYDCDGNGKVRKDEVTGDGDGKNEGQGNSYGDRKSDNLGYAW